jgi:hypothetical protein
MTTTIAERITKTFALILTQHRLWGTILMPYILQVETGRRYYRLAECLTPFQSSDALDLLSPEERDLVNMINEYNERTLYKLFSKDRSVKDFLVNTTRDKIDTFIRPYIERRIYKCFAIARDENIPVYYQKTKTSTIHSEDRLSVAEEMAKPVFRFIRDSEQTTYNLSLDGDGRLIDLKRS